MEPLQVKNESSNSIKILSVNKKNTLYITALRTKPFLLLAGISGTGKSQKVQELAFMTCQKVLCVKRVVQHQEIIV